MAVWHYKFSLVPRAGVSRIHGCIPERLPGYQTAREPEEGEEDEDEAHPNYWEGSLAPETYSSEIAAILKIGISWSQDATMYGCSADNQIQVWNQREIDVRLNLQRPNIRLLQAIAEFASLHDLLVVPSDHGRPLEPTPDTMLKDVQTSRAYGFCKDPQAYLKTAAEE